MTEGRKGAEQEGREGGRRERSVPVLSREKETSITVQGGTVSEGKPQGLWTHSEGEEGTGA